MGLNKVKVVSISDESITFDNGVVLHSHHNSECCESHYLSLADLTIADFEGLEFDISNDNFFERIVGYGIALKPLNGHPVRIPGYGYNNGYYSSQLDLILEGDGFEKVYDISDCQVIEG